MTGSGHDTEDQQEAHEAPATLFAAPAPDGSERFSDEAFLSELGHRVRRLRGGRGLSRKALAQNSGVSERYIAQLETGKGNVSVLLLRHLCAATQTRLDDLFADVEGKAGEWATFRSLLARADTDQIAKAIAMLAPPQGAYGAARAHRIALVGLRGAGKSTLGRLAAQELGWPFVELNREIERDNGLSVSEIFALYGQDGYRRLEHATLRNLIGRPGPMLLATNGGLVSEASTLELLLANFYTIWIKAGAQEHMSRVRRQGAVRPALDDRAVMHELRAALAAREALYAKANATLDTSSCPVQQSLDDLLSIIERAEHIGKIEAPEPSEPLMSV